MIDTSSIDFVDLLNEIGLRNVRMTNGGVEVSYSCHHPVHSHGDDSPSAYVNSETGLFYCHACRLKGNVVDLVMFVMEVSRATAERFLRDKYGIQFDEPKGGSMVAETESRFRPAMRLPSITTVGEPWISAVRLDWTGDLEPYQRYMIERGLTRETLAEHDIGYDYTSDRLTIPVRALDGSLFGVKGRAWTSDRQPRFLVLGDPLQPYADRQLRYGFHSYPVAEVVFGLHRARDHHRLILVEAELDSIALRQMGIIRPVATGGAKMSDRQARLIVDECDEVVIAYDAGDAGQAGARIVAAALEPYVMVRIASPTDVDPCDALRDGREDEILAAIDEARSSLASRLVFR